MEQWTERWVTRARALKTDVVAVALAYRDPRVPWYARLVAICVVAYALSPIDLIPDPIPVLGYLDDLVLVPLGIALAVRLIPRDVLAECRVQARTVTTQGKPTKWIAAGAIITIGVLSAAIGRWWLLGWWQAR